jgi:hypothetical protein
LLVSDRGQDRDQAVPILLRGLGRCTQALSEPGFSALPDRDLLRRASFRLVVLLGVELLFELLELVSDFCLGPAVHFLAGPLGIRVEAARNFADEALARLPPVDRVLASAAPSHVAMLAVMILDGYHYGYRSSLPWSRHDL